MLNAKYHEKEAEIVAQAGHKGAVTIATNMAGRGTDIMLGGNAEYMAKADLRQDGLCGGADGRRPPAYADTEDEDILAVPAGRYAELEAKHKEADSPKRPMRCAPRAACSSWAPSATNPAALTTSCAGRAGRQGDPGASRFFI